MQGHNSGNCRNGSCSKAVKTDSMGNVALSIPQYRNASFEPGVLPKYATMTDKLESAIISMYSRGMTTLDISEQVAESYGVSISASAVSNITAKLLQDVKAWLSRPLEKAYFIVCMVVD